VAGTFCLRARLHPLLDRQRLRPVPGPGVEKPAGV